MYVLNLRKTLVALAAAVTMAGCGTTAPLTPITPTVTMTVSSVAPTAGSTTGGTTITLTGTGFGSDTTVSVGGVAATGVVVANSSSLTAVTPTHVAGAVSIVATSAGRTATAATGFTFVAPSGANLPPAITAMRSIGSRTNQPSGFADIGETLTLTATVTDKETSAADLTFAWTVPQGSVSGTGPSVAWVLPSTVSSTPATMTVTLTVTEPFTEGGVTHRNVSTSTLAMTVHDSQNEILNMGKDFLELFSQSQYTPDQVLHNFSTTCDGGNGRSDEYNDVRDNRYYFQELPGWSVTKAPPVTFNFAGRCAFRSRRADACSRYAVHWYDQRLVYDPRFPTSHVGDRGETWGIDYVTAVLDSGQWKLCHSDYQANELPEALNGYAQLLFFKHGGGDGKSPIPPLLIR